MKVQFCHATQTDLEPIVAIYNQTIPTRLATADLEPVTVASRQGWFDAHDAVRRPLWVMKHGELLIGWISLSDFYGRPAYDSTVEVSIYIDKDYQGKQLGQAALEYVENHVKELRIETILAFVFGHNQASQHLFKKNGFEVWGHLSEVAIMDSIHRDLDILGKAYR